MSTLIIRYTYERLKRDALSRQLLDEPTFGISFACGGLAGALAALVTQPFDVVKTRTQIAIGEQLSKHSLDLPRRCECPTGTVWQSTALLYRQNGLSALYAGEYAVPNILIPSFRSTPTLDKSSASVCDYDRDVRIR